MLERTRITVHNAFVALDFVSAEFALPTSSGASLSMPLGEGGFSLRGWNGPAGAGISCALA